MATLNYIAGQQIQGADRYHLECQKADGSYKRIETRNVIQGFRHKGIIVDGKVKEESFFLDRFGGQENGSVSLVPLRVLTETGVRLCVKVYGEVTLTYADGIRIYKVFETVHYIENPSGEIVSVHMPQQQNQIIQNGDNWYLNVIIDGEENFSRILAGDGNIASVAFYPTYNDLKVYGVALANEYEHTDYIRIGCLTDDYAVPGTSDFACVGTFDFSVDFGYSKMSFYNKNLKFVGDATANYLGDEFGGKTSFTKEEIYEIFKAVVGDLETTDEDYPTFVVFCSKASKTSNYDRVSVGNPYFPLFDMPSVDLAFETEEVSSLKLSVIADTRLAGYTPSNRSNEVTYTKPE